MQIVVNREYFTNLSSEGNLTLDNNHECYTIEDKDRNLESGGEKVYGETAIPRGIYKVKLTYSPRFKQILPEILDVPGFTGVRIHWGNKPEDTEGCIIVGATNKFKGDNFIGDSRVAWAKLMTKLKEAVANEEEITIEVK